MDKNIIGWKVVAIEYHYKGRQFMPDSSFTGHGRRLVNVDDSKDRLWLQPGMTYFKAGVETRRKCYPIFEKVSKVTI